MKMVFRIAWRNIWRNRTRSLVVMTSIALGIWAGMFIISFSWGMYDHRIEQAIKSEISNIQVHDSLFQENFDIDRSIPNHEQVLAKLKLQPSVKHISARTITMCMMGSAHGNQGVKLVGIDTAQERVMSGINEKVTEGKFLNGTRVRPIVIGKKLAEKLKVKLKSTLVVTFEDAHGEIIAEAFKVSGIYQMSNRKFEEMNAYVHRSDLQEIAGLGGAIHEIAISLTSNELTDTIASQLKTKLPGVLVQSWGELMPEMSYAIEMFDQIMNLIIFIIMLALAFGIINTMLMAVLERVRELGMLMAVGMNRTKIFSMVMFETVFLTLAGAPIGLLLSWLTIQYFGNHGIDLSLYSDGLASFGFDSLVFLKAEQSYYIKMMFQVILVAFISGIFPARRALKLNPVEALSSL